MSSGTLPFTGTLFTLPLAIVGAVMTFGGWVLRKHTEPTL